MALPFAPDEYWEWKEKFEAGYGQPRVGVSADEVEKEIAEIPKGLRHTYIFEKYIGIGGTPMVMDDGERPIGTRERPNKNPRKGDES